MQRLAAARARTQCLAAGRSKGCLREEQHRIHELREERKRQEHREREEQRLLQAEDESDGRIVRRTEWIVVLDQRGQYLHWRSRQLSSTLST